MENAVNGLVDYKDSNPSDVIKKGRKHEPFRQVIQNSLSCMACGYTRPLEDPKPKAPVTGAAQDKADQVCPECGAILHRLSSVELAYYGFVDPDSTPIQMELLPEPQKSDVKFSFLRGDVEVPTVDVYTGGKALSFAMVSPIGQKESTYKDFRQRFEATLKRSSALAMRMLAESCVLVLEDGRTPRFGYRAGVFGRSKLPLIESISHGLPITLAEARKATVRFVSDDKRILTVEINGKRFGFTPRVGFPVDGVQVSASIFEDFVRRFKNLREDAGRAVCFLLGHGELTEAVVQPDAVVVRPSTPQAFLHIVRKAIAEGRHWSGSPQGMTLAGDTTTVQGLLAEADAKAVVIEDTTSEDMPDANVVFASRFPSYREFTRKVLAGVGGNPVEFGVAEQSPNFKVKGVPEATLIEMMAALGDATPHLSQGEDGYTFVQSSLKLEHILPAADERRRVFEQVQMYAAPRMES